MILTRTISGFAGEKRQWTAALQDANAQWVCRGKTRSVLECGSPLPLSISINLLNTGRLFLLVLLLAAPMARAQSTNLTTLLQQGLLEEQANGNLNAAIADYRSLAEQFDKNRQVAATAVFRLGECYRAQSKTNEAVVQYQRILREFSDQQTLAMLSRQNLTGLGAALTETPAEIDSAATNDYKRYTALLASLNTEKSELLSWTTTNNPQVRAVVSRIARAEATLQRIEEKFPGIAAAAQAEVATAASQTNGNEAAKLWAAVKDLPKDQLEKVLPTLVSDSLLENLVQQLSAAKQKFTEIQSAYGKNAPLYKNQEALLETLQMQVVDKIDGTMQALKIRAEMSKPSIARAGEPTSNDLSSNEDSEIQRILHLMQNSPDLVNSGELNQAARKGELKVATFLLNNGADVNGPHNGSTPLGEAGDAGQKTMVELLLSRGADVNQIARDGSGSTALLKAAARGYQAVVEVLLAHKANPNLEDKDGRTPLSWATQHGHPEIEKVLLTAKADPNGGKLDAPLLFAIYLHDAPSAELLLGAGANPNSIDDYNLEAGRPSTTPLWLATLTYQLPMVKLLLKYNVDVNGTTNGRPYYFDSFGSPEMLEVLLDAGANLNFRDSKGNSPLIYAVSERRPAKTLELLLAHKVDPNLQNSDGVTALSLVNGAGYTNPAEIADLLRHYGAMDNPPQWDRITVNRLSGQEPHVVFYKGTNDWNHFTLLETILNYYVLGFQNETPGQHSLQPMYNGDAMQFPDLSRVVIVRPSHSSTNVTQITVNLLDKTNGIDTSKDVRLEFGDMVEISQEDHPLGYVPSWLSDAQMSSLINYLHGTGRLVINGQKADLPLDPYSNGSRIDVVLRQPEARRHLLTSSDLSRVKVTRHDPKTGKESQWTLDCTAHSQSSATQNTYSPPDLVIRDGDVIEVPEKP
ncbi:MAG TPA: ankyrin repeat domain-containing protein [Verrucomicrobiae bacterium]